MAIQRPLLSLALTLCLTPVFLLAIPLPADCETDASPDDPGYEPPDYINHPFSPSRCRHDHDATAYHCSNGNCGKVSEYTADKNGKISFTVYGVEISLDGKANEKTWVSARFISNGWEMVQCTDAKPACPKPTCFNHGIGCGVWRYYVGESCAAPGTGKGYVQGWGKGCGLRTDP